MLVNFAKIQNGVVQQVIVLNDKEALTEEAGIAFCQKHYNDKNVTWKRVDYNSGRAGIGYSFDNELKIFISPKPFASWTFNKTLKQWVSPKSYPVDDKNYSWNEEKRDWIVNENSR